MKYETLKIQEDGPLVALTIHRPEKLNALSIRVLTELKDFLSALKRRKLTVRGMTVTGSGEKAFIAGADIREMSAMSAGQGDDFGKLGQEVTVLLEGLPFPVIACVNGYAFGGGCEIALACDFIFATEAAVFGQPEVNLGLIPGFGGCVRLFRRVGPGKAKEMIYSGRRVDAQEARRLGLVNDVYPSAEKMNAAARALLLEMAAKSAEAISICKSIINRADGRTIPEGLEIERSGFRAAFEGKDKQEGTAAFLEKRKPDFDRDII